MCDTGIHAVSVRAEHCSQTVWTVPEYLRAPRLRQRFLPEPGHGGRGPPLARGSWWPSPLFPELLGVWGLGWGARWAQGSPWGWASSSSSRGSYRQGSSASGRQQVGAILGTQRLSPAGSCPSSQIGGTRPRGTNDLPAEPASGFVWLRAEKRGDAPPAQGGKEESLRAQETAVSGRQAGVRRPLRPETPARPTAVASDRCPCP